MKWLNAMNSIIFRLFLSAGLWNAPLAGLINAADFGKTVKDFFKILFRCFLLLLFVLFSEDTKQALRQFIQFSHQKYNKDVICSYISFLHNTYKPKTAKRKIATLKAFTHYLMIEDIIEINQFDKIDTSFREPALLPKIIPLDIIRRILAAAYSELSSASTLYKKKAASRDVAVL